MLVTNYVRHIIANQFSKCRVPSVITLIMIVTIIVILIRNSNSRSQVGLLTFWHVTYFWLKVALIIYQFTKNVLSALVMSNDNCNNKVYNIAYSRQINRYIEEEFQSIILVSAHSVVWHCYISWCKYRTHVQVVLLKFSGQYLPLYVNT